MPRNIKMILLNAVYFKGFWSIPFEKSMTMKRPFYKSNSCQYDIQRKFLDQFMSMIKASNLRLNYKISYETQCDEFILTPYNKLNAVIFENDLRKEIEINPKDIEKYKTEYPEKVKL